VVANLQIAPIEAADQLWQATRVDSDVSIPRKDRVSRTIKWRGERVLNNLRRLRLRSASSQHVDRRAGCFL